MDPRRRSSVADRMQLIELVGQGLTLRKASAALGFSRDWGRRWRRRYGRQGLTALDPPPPPPRGALATFSSIVQTQVLAIRHQYPLLGARRAVLLLETDPTLRGQPLPSARTIHRAWVAAGLVTPTAAREAPPRAPALPVDPGDPHAVWPIDHQDGIRVPGLETPVVLQDVRAPAAGVIVGADLFAGPRGAHAVPMDTVLDGLRGCFVRFGKPRARSVDAGLHFLGQSQRSFPSRCELFCAGLSIAVVPIRPARPTDHGAVERQHRTLDGFLLGPARASLPEAQAALDAHVTALNTRFRSRARVCAGSPPLTAHPAARHSGRPYDPAAEWDRFDLAAVHRLLATWRWCRKVSPPGQISFADRHVGVDRTLAGTYVQLRFDPADRQMVVYAPGVAPATLGPEPRRFACPAFTKATVLGSSRIAPHPPNAGDDSAAPTG